MEGVVSLGFDFGEVGLELVSILCPLFCELACAAVILPKATGADNS